MPGYLGEGHRRGTETPGACVSAMAETIPPHVYPEVDSIDWSVHDAFKSVTDPPVPWVSAAFPPGRTPSELVQP